MSASKTELLSTGQGLRGIYREALAARGFEPDPAQQTGIERLEKLRAELLEASRDFDSVPRKLLGFAAAPRRPGIRGVYLWGGVGRGKTWIMDLFFQSLPFDAKRRVHFHRFMHDVHAELTRLRGEPNPLDKVARRVAEEVRVLGLDELFVADIADAMILGALFKSLVARGVTLVITSNVPPSGLYADGLQRQRFVAAIVLLERQLDVLAVDGPVDYRLRQLAQMPIYLDASDPATPERLRALFQTLLGGGAATTAPLEVGGRSIPVVGASERVVWFEFAALCDGPRSQEDYLELARDYRTVLVAGVPQFDERNDNAARRFVALVDEFYDRGVNLIVSAAAAPAALYRGERLAFDFRRTASRLIEMQSEAYLARAHLG